MSVPIDSPTRRPAALIVGCEGTRLGDAERRLFREGDPLGLILFQRNCASPDQVRALVDDFRDCVGRADTPVMVDQEGGRVARLKPPHWRKAPAAGVFATAFHRDPEGARKAVRGNARLIAAELRAIGITVDCAPVLDVRHPDGHGVIGDRAFGDDAETVTVLAREMCAGLLDGGVLPVVKHAPGHGRANADSHESCPVVETDAETLRRTDFVPFRALADMPWGMTAHVVYAAFDAARPGTVSPTVIGRVIRGEIGFDGLLVSDDLSMKALGGSLEERALAALAAGCDVALHCSGRLSEMEDLLAACPPLTAEAETRLQRGEAMRGRSAVPVDLAETAASLEAWLRDVRA